MNLGCDGQDTPVWHLHLAPDADGHVALEPDSVAALESLLLQAQATVTCRVVVVHGSSTEFCRGMALGTRLAPDAVAVAISQFARCLTLLRTMSAATIAVIEGPALGGGVGLAAACDLTIAGPNARFHLPELLYGLIPAVIFPVVAARIGMARTRWLALSGVTLDPPAATALGLCDEVSAEPARSLYARLKWLLRVHPEAVARLKEFANTAAELPLATAQERGIARTSADLQSSEVSTALAHLAAGELPPWSLPWPPRSPAKP